MPMDNEPLDEPPPFETYNSPEYHDLVGRAGRYAANYLAERRAELVNAEFEVSAMADDSGFVERVRKAEAERDQVGAVLKQSEAVVAENQQAFATAEGRVRVAKGELQQFRKEHGIASD